MTARRLLMPLTFLAMAALGGSAAGQGASPAPLPEGPPAAVVPPDPARCRAEIAQLQQLREEAQHLFGMIKLARERKLGPRETCDLYKRHMGAEVRLVSHAETLQTACAIPADLVEQLKASQKRSSELVGRICAAANNQPPVDQSPLFRLRPGDPLPDQAPFKVLRAAQFSAR